MNQKAPAPVNSDTLNKGFIPNFCDLQSVLVIVVSTQVLAFVISLIKTENMLLDWQVLGFTSLLLNCVSLSTAATLCTFRTQLSRQSVAFQTSFALATVIIMTALASWFSIRLLEYDDREIVGFVTRNTLVSSLLSGLVLRYFYLDNLAKRREKAELQSRIEALQSRIRPHFLFNSMNSIASLIASKPDEAENAVLDLSELFRASLNTQSSYVPISEELSLCKKYLNIERLRLGERLMVEWAINDEVLHHLIPPLTLQPLVENAIYHGIQPIQDGGTIRLESYISNDCIYLLISNPVAPNKPSQHGNQIALGNIADRLAALYSKQAVLKTSKFDNTFTTTLRIPVKHAQGNALR